MRSTRSTTFLAAAVGTAVASALLVAPAQAAPPETPQPGDTYVALGSSYAAGAGVGPVDPGDAGGCGRTLIDYSYLVAQALDLDRTSAACGGAKVENIATTPQRDTVPLQIEAVTADTELVTITIGGNDLDYVANLGAEACLADLAADPTSAVSLARQQAGQCTPSSDETVDAALAGLEDEMTTMIEAVRAKAPDARIVMVDYLTVLPRDAKPCDVMPIPRPRQKVLLDVARQLSLTTKRAADATGSGFVAASKVSRRHDVCSDDPWMTGYDFAPGRAIMHPNAAGHAAVAAAVVRELTHRRAAS